MCPCGLNNSYENCCGIAHNDITKVETAEQLMRSRYTAFTMGNGDYLMNSHHSETCPYSDKQAIVDWAKSVIWEKLEVINTSQGMGKDTTGTVEFKAYYIENSKQKCLHEHSAFTKENNHWVYFGIV